MGATRNTRRRYAIPVPIQRRRKERILDWHVSSRTHFRFQELLEELVSLEWADTSSPEVQDRMAALRDDIRHLPGFPRAFHPERDIINPVVTTAQR